MSLKRPLSPELNSNRVQQDTRQVKRLKLHSIIEQLRTEEAKLVLLKKLRTSQQLANRTNKNSMKITSDLPSTTNRITNTNKPVTTLPVQVPPQPQPQPIPPPISTTRKVSNSPVLTQSSKSTSSHSFEERQNQAKSALRKQLERDLLSIPPPKPSLQDILFIPNGASLEFPPLIGLEDVIQCLNELHNDRHRLPQRFTDHASIDNPYICDQCGTDFTIRWWKHTSSKSTNETMNILCDRCKKQVIRRTSKSEHSSILKNAFLSAMKQEKEIEKNFHSLIKQEKASSRVKASSLLTHPPLPPPTTTSIHHSSSKQQYQPKTSISQPTRKGNGIVSTSNHHSRTPQSTKTSMPIHHQPFRSNTTSSQHSKSNPMIKPSKNTGKHSTVLPPSRPIFPTNSDLLQALFASNFVAPTSTKRRTVPPVELK